MKNSIALILWLASLSLLAQPTFPSNGPKNEQTRSYALVNVTLFVDYQTKIENATLLVKNDKVVYAGANKQVEKSYTVIDCKGKFIYPAFIDLVSNYGIQTPLNHNRNEHETKQFTSVKKGAYNWNEAIKAEVNGVDYFSGDEKKAQSLREYGFATVLTGLHDGIFI
jgi:imidazolonepropionase-like amidohydrolase